MNRLVLVAALIATPALADVPKPAAIVADGAPAVPVALAAKTRPYMEFRTASFSGWNVAGKSMLISTRFGDVAQLHSVAAPMMDRRQISFEAEPVRGSWSPKGDVLVVNKDTGGSEFFQIYTLKNGQLTLLTDGKSRNNLNGWNQEGSLIGYSSTRRNGTDTDLYVMDPRDPKSNRMVAQVKGGGWGIADFLPDGKTAIVGNFISITKTNLFTLDLASGALTPIGDHSKTIPMVARNPRPMGFSG